MYNYVSHDGRLPSAATLQKAPVSVNADEMTDDELRVKLKSGYDDIEKGNIRSAQTVFSDFREAHRQ